MSTEQKLIDKFSTMQLHILQSLSADIADAKYLARLTRTVLGMLRTAKALSKETKLGEAQQNTWQATQLYCVFLLEQIAASLPAAVAESTAALDAWALLTCYDAAASAASALASLELEPEQEEKLQQIKLSDSQLEALKAAMLNKDY